MYTLFVQGVYTIPLPAQTFSARIPYCVAGVVELADTLDLGSSAERLGGSNPLARNLQTNPKKRLFFGIFLRNLFRPPLCISVTYCNLL